jgi:hypothetical protein
MSDLISISPEEVLRPNVLIRIFNSLFQRRQVAPVLPMLVPQIPRIDTTEDEARYNYAARGQWDESGHGSG